MVSHSELLHETADVLQDEGFTVYQSPGMMRYFDLIGVGDYKLFIKVLANVDNLHREEGSELNRLAGAFSSRAVIVGDHAGMEKLHDDIVYQRFKNLCVNLRTLKHLLSGESISRFTERGQLLVKVDGDKIRDLREEMGLTRNELAGLLGCSSQAVYRIETQDRMSEDTYEKALALFKRGFSLDGITTVKENRTDISKDVGYNPTQKGQLGDPLKRRVTSELTRLHFNSVSFNSPIDFALEDKPLLTPVSMSEAEMRRKQRVAKSLSEVLYCDVLHITRERRARRLPCISIDELKKAESKEEILEKGKDE